MTTLLLPSRPQDRPARLALRGLVAASLLMAVCIAGQGWRQRPAGPPAATNPLADLSMQEDVPPTWPADLAEVADMFLCWPTGARDKEAPVVVWTGRTDQVAAFASVLEGAPAPRYAAALGATAAADADQPVRAARDGHAMRMSGSGIALQLDTVTLACERTWDD